MTLAWWAAVVALCGCGRIGFEARTSAGAGDAAGADGTPDAASGIVVVQTSFAVTTTLPAVTVVTAATRPGNLIVVLAGSNPGHVITSVTDNAGNTYTLANAFASDPNSGEADYWYAANANGGVTAILVQSSSNDCGGLVYELSGCAPTSPLANKSTRSNQPAATTIAGAPLTTTVPGEMILTNADVQNSVIDLRAGAGFINDAPAMSTDGVAHLLATTPGTYAATWDQDVTGTYATSSVSFKPAP